MITPRRYRALHWFDDHSRDRHSVYGQKVPSKKIRNLMIRDGQLEAVPVGSFGHLRFELTAAGRALMQHRLAGRPQHKPKESSDDGNGHERHDRGDGDDDERQRRADANPGE